MDDNSDVNMEVFSGGSDIEVDDLDDSDDNIDLNDGLECNQIDERDEAWLHAFFNSDSENEADFEVFQDEWVRDNFSPRLQPRFKLIDYILLLLT